MNYNKSGIEKDKKIKKLQKENAELKKQLKSEKKEKLDEGKRTIFFTKLQPISGIFFAIFFSCYLQNTRITFLSKNEIGLISIILFIIFIISLIKGK